MLQLFFVLPLFFSALDYSLSRDEEAVVWWVVAFTCLFQSLHSISSRAVSWLLKFLGTLFLFFGQYSDEVSRIAKAFPATLHRRSNFLRKKLSLPAVRNYVVCSSCHSLFKFEHCLERRHLQIVIKPCSCCIQDRRKKEVPLLKQIVTSKGNRKY